MRPNEPRQVENGLGKAEPPWGTKRLNFSLPDFTRQMWVSDKARQLWERRILTIGKIWAEIECLSVGSHIRPCALLWFSQEELVEWNGRLSRSGLKTVVLAARLRKIDGNSARSNKPDPRKLDFRVAIGARPDLASFKGAWVRGDVERIGQLLGYPSCCRNFFRQVFVEQGYTDSTWATAWNTASPAEETCVIDVSVLPQLNILWRPIGLKVIPHFPCRLDCPASLDIADQFLSVGEDAGYKTELNWAMEILGWPNEWSALHGIAEIKTPIVKIAIKTDATQVRYTVRRHSVDYPQEGARGLTFLPTDSNGV